MKLYFYVFIVFTIFSIPSFVFSEVEDYKLVVTPAYASEQKERFIKQDIDLSKNIPTLCNYKKYADISPCENVKKLLINMQKLADLFNSNKDKVKYAGKFELKSWDVMSEYFRYDAGTWKRVNQIQEVAKIKTESKNTAFNSLPRRESNTSKDHFSLAITEEKNFTIDDYKKEDNRLSSEKVAAAQEQKINKSRKSGNAVEEVIYSFSDIFDDDKKKSDADKVANSYKSKQMLNSISQNSSAQSCESFVQNVENYMRSVFPGGNDPKHYEMEAYNLQTSLRFYQAYDGCTASFKDMHKNRVEDYLGSIGNPRANSHNADSKEIEKNLSKYLSLANSQYHSSNQVSENSNTESDNGLGDSKSGNVQCDNKLAEFEKETKKASRRELEGVVYNSERVMWLTSESIRVINSYCQGTSATSDVVRLKQVYNQAKETCQQVSSGGNCSPNPHY